MGRREVETTSKRVIRTCDLCGRDLGGISPERCLVCGREAGYCCSTLRLACDPKYKGLIDLALRVCRDCELAGREVTGMSYLELIQDKVSTCDHAVARLLALWREWSEEWRQRKGGVG